MGAQFTIPLVTVIPGQLIASTLWNNEFNNINTNFIPAGMDSYSDTDAQMQIQTNPYPSGVTSHASNLGGEIERIRFQFALAFGLTYWYQNPQTAAMIVNTLTASTITANSNNPALVVSLNGTPQASLGVNSNDTVIYFGGVIGRLLFNIINTSTNVFYISPTDAGFQVPLNMNSNKIIALTQGTNSGDAIAFPVGTAQIAAQAITPTLLGAVAGSGMTGGSGSILGVSVDNSTIGVNGSNQVVVPNGGIGLAQLAAAANPFLSTGNRYNQTANVTTLSTTYSGRGKLLYVRANVPSGGPDTITIVLDGVTKANISIAIGPEQYVAPDGSLSSSYAAFGLDFASSLFVQLSGNNSKTLDVGYATP